MNAANNLTFVAKLRWEPKKPEQAMTIRNYEAVRLMANAIINEMNGKLAEAQAFEAKAINEMEKELRDYLGGIKHVIARDRSEAYVGSEL